MNDIDGGAWGNTVAWSQDPLRERVPNCCGRSPCRLVLAALQGELRTAKLAPHNPDCDEDGDEAVEDPCCEVETPVPVPPTRRGATRDIIGMRPRVGGSRSLAGGCHGVPALLCRLWPTSSPEYIIYPHSRPIRTHPLQPSSPHHSPPRPPCVSLPPPPAACPVGER